MSCKLEINNLHFRYEKKPVISGLSLSTSQASIIGLLGLNGEGKSTLLKIIAGILPIEGDSISCTTTTGNSLNPVGFLSERPLFYPELSITENIQFAAQIQGTAASSIKEQVNHALQICQLSERKNQLAGNLSKGFQQRLGLAMALVHQPQLLLLDEPTDGLDPRQIGETHELIRSLATNSTVIISSHRLDEISQLCDRLLILHQGKLVHDANICDQSERDNLAELFQKIISEART